MQTWSPSQRLAYRFCVRAVSLLGAMVPSALRKRWVEEWKAELWYETERDRNRLKLILRLAGAVRDALSTLSLHQRESADRSPSEGDRKSTMLIQNLKFASRSLVRRPGFSLLTVLTLALGIGANTSIFGVINAVLLKPLPYTESDRLVKVVGFRTDQGESGNLSPADFLDIEKDNQVFVRMGALGWVGWFTVTGNGEPDRVPGSQVTAGFFPTLEVAPILGRVFTREEDEPGAPSTAIITQSLWKRRFGSDGDIVGKTIGLNAVPTTIIGVLPPDYVHPEPNPEREPEIYSLYQFDPSNAGRSGRFIRAIGRLRPNGSMEKAQAELETLAARLEKEYPDSNTARSVSVSPLLDAIVSESRPALLLLLVAVAFVLLIACANIANLLLAAGMERRKELAIRTALGAGRNRLIYQMLSESLLLSLVGGGLGLVFAFWATRSVDWLSVGHIPRAAAVNIDGPVLGFAFTVALFAAFAFGVVPALQLSRTDPQVGLRDGRHDRPADFSRNLLIMAEVALSVVLLIGAGLLLRSYWQLKSTSPGFEPQRVITMQMSLPLARYEEGEQIPFYEELYRRIGSLLGVSTVGAINILPLSQNHSKDGFQIDDRPVPSGQMPAAEARSINPDYFRAMGIPLLRGREFDGRDSLNAPGVVIISDSMARRFWPNEDPLGKHITYNRGIPDENRNEVGGSGSREIVGIVGNVKHFGLGEENVPMFYTPQPQHPSFHSMTLVIRMDLDSETVASSARQQLWEMDKEIPIYGVQTLDTVLAKSVAAPRFRTHLLGIFAGFAVLLSLIGIYGVVGYLVRQRTLEIGIRIALGARKGDIRKMLLVQGIKPIAIGLGIGLMAATALTRMLSGLLFGIAPIDPVTFITVPALLVVAALMATFLPTERATRIDPVDTLRAE